MTERRSSDRRETDAGSRRVAVIVGLLFLTATVTFMLGDALVAGYFSADPGAAGTGTLVAGVALQAMCGLAVAGIGFAMLELLGRHSTALATGYLAFRCLELAVIVGIGVYMLSTKRLVPNYEHLIYVFTGIGGLLLSYLLLRARLVPAWLAWLGIVGYAVLLLAFPVELLGLASLQSGPGMLFYVPGGLFELLLPILLLARGFRRTDAEPPVMPGAQASRLSRARG